MNSNVATLCLLPCVLGALAPIGRAEAKNPTPPATIEVRLEDREGVLPILALPSSIPIPLLPEPGEQLTALPKGLGDRDLYGVLAYGSPDGALSILVRRMPDGKERVILDMNDNEDLTDDPELVWEENPAPAHREANDPKSPADLPTVRTRLRLACPSLPDRAAPGVTAEVVEIAIILRRFDPERVPSSQAKPGTPNAIMATIDSYRLGTLNVGGSERGIAVVPTQLSPRGPFDHRATAVVVDLNSDYKLDGHPFKSRERYRPGGSFTMGKEAYQIRGIACDGRRLVLAPVDPVLANLQRRRPGSGPAPGDQAPDFALATIDGDSLRLKDYRGRIVLLDFWAVWCGPCRGELPHVRQAYKRYHDRGFDIVGVSLDNSIAQLREFTQANGMTWPQIFQGRGVDTSLKQNYGVSSIPSTFLIDRDGRVAAAQLRGPQLSQAVEALLKQGTQETKRSD